MHRMKWIRGGCLAGAVFMAAALFVGAKKVGELHLFPEPYDKLAHFVYYGIMCLLLVTALGRRWRWLAVAIVAAVGAADEIHQIYVPGRDASVFDWTADLLGAVFSVAVVHRYFGITFPNESEW